MHIPRQFLFEKFEKNGLDYALKAQPTQHTTCAKIDA